MIRILKKEDCYGCETCAQICPHGCITMREDAEGFLYPQVDEDGCIQCGLCLRACPAGKYQPHHAKTTAIAYAAYAKDDAVRAVSSSGGLFTLLAEVILDQGGVVFGAAYDKDLTVRHISVESKENLGMLRKSKYLQSRTENAYLEAKKALVAGRKVLYTGTGCQINGLKGFLGTEPDGLYTVEVACHGVPSPKLWLKYLRSRSEQEGASAVRAEFRKKETAAGWKESKLEITFDDGEKSALSSDRDAYIQCFLSDICLRPSCYTCKFKGYERDSDLMIGDCWGIDRLMPDMDDDLGTSFVVVYSEKGREMLGLIEDKLVLRRGDVKRLLRPNTGALMPAIRHDAREEFMSKLAMGANMDELAKLVKPTFFFRVKRKLKIYSNIICLSLRR